MAATPKAKASTEIDIPHIAQGEASFAVIGTHPLIYNRMSEKAKRTLLLPSGRKNDAEKAANLKHAPIDEYRDSVYRYNDDRHVTRLKFPCAAFKGALETAALDMPGTKKTEIGRLAWVEGEYTDLFGVPKLLMSVVRSADMNRTPDIRTRAIVSEWACVITVNFVQPKLNVKAISNLLAAAGIIAGVGDWRQEKGSASYGQFRLCDRNDPDFKRILAKGARVAQDGALKNYACYDDETQELLDWYTSEVIKRGRDKPILVSRREHGKDAA